MTVLVVVVVPRLPVALLKENYLTVTNGHGEKKAQEALMADRITLFMCFIFCKKHREQKKNELQNSRVL